MSRNWFSIRNSAPDALIIDIHDEIGMWGVSAKDFSATLKAAGKPSSITLNLDCPGGDCNDGFTIFDSLKNSGADITVNITGLAASMASVIMLAGNRIRIAENGRVMVHRVTGGAVGTADEMDAAAKVIKQFEDRIVALYMERTGSTENEIRDLMKAQLGTWFFGQEAIDAGFADELIQGAKAKAFRGEWASKFTYLPAALFDTARASMDTEAEPVAPDAPVAPAEISPAVEPDPAPVAEPAVEPPAPVEPDPAPVEPEAKGILQRIAAAFSGDAAMKNELATARSLLAARDSEIAALKAQLDTATAKAAQFDAVTAELAKLEAAQKTVASAAAEIAASHGLRPAAVAELPTPSNTLSVIDEFHAITDPAAKREFYLKNQSKLRAAA